jgi:hypothetical protein
LRAAQLIRKLLGKFATATLLTTALIALISATLEAPVAAAPVSRPVSGSTQKIESSGCNNYVCIEAQPYGPVTGKVRVQFVDFGCPQQAYFHVWGPNFDFETPVQQYCSFSWTPWYGQFARGTYCAEGFWWVYPGRYESVGLPCVNV